MPHRADSDWNEVNLANLLDIKQQKRKMLKNGNGKSKSHLHLYENPAYQVFQPKLLFSLSSLIHIDLMQRLLHSQRALFLF
jgi:Fe-S cluster assembly ATPase SufC